MLVITCSQQICAEIVKAACSTLSDNCIFEEIKEIIRNVDSKCNFISKIEYKNANNVSIMNLLLVVSTVPCFLQILCLYYHGLIVKNVLSVKNCSIFEVIFGFIFINYFHK